MADTFAAAFSEAQSFQGGLGNLHPLTLDRWHRGLIGLPDAIYMQYGCPMLLEQVQIAVAAIASVQGVLGAGNLPVEPQEISRRQIRLFTWHVPSEFDDTGTVTCSLTWDKETSAWQLTCSVVDGTLKTVPDFQIGVKKAIEWGSQLQPPVREDTEE
jgi:hypothetical protein